MPELFVALQRNESRRSKSFVTPFFQMILIGDAGDREPHWRCSHAWESRVKYAAGNGRFIKADRKRIGSRVRNGCHDNAEMALAFLNLLGTI